jgi:type 1 glutamine amidotransferase
MNERKALIVWGGWEGHQPDQCASIVEKFLVEDGFLVTKENQTAVFGDPDLGRFDLIIPIYSMGNITESAAKNLSATILET